MTNGRRVAAIDVGTNSVHMIIVESQRHGYRVIDKEKEMVQLGRDSLEGRPLTEAAIDRGVATLRTMAEIARRWKVDDVIAVATSAIREAPNRRQFLTAAEKVSGIRVRVISGEEEADYIYRAVRAAVDFHSGTALVIDIGGGSVELIVGTAEEVFFTQSERLGALRVAQRFGLESATGSAAVGKCAAFVRRRLKKALAPVDALGFDFTIGTSGTIVTLATIAAERAAAGEVASGLRWLSHKRLVDIIAEMTSLTTAERARRFGIDEKRAATLLAGAVVLDQVMDLLRVKQLRACDAALREGLIEKRLAELQERRSSSNGSGSVRRSSVMDLAERSGVDLSHARHVAALALRLFDQTQELHKLRTGERELLEYAALLHEVGMHVSYQGHHKHSYYLISHAGLRGFTGDQVALIANVARYHRKALPDEAHGSFAALSPARREIVVKLTAILRVADALDRGRRGAVRDVRATLGRKRVRVTVRPRHRAEIEINAASRKSKYLARVFDRKVELLTATR